MNADLIALVAPLMPRQVSQRQIEGCDFRDLGMDSMGFLQLFSLIETEYGIEIPDDDMTLENFGSLAGLHAYLAAKSPGAVGLRGSPSG